MQEQKISIGVAIALAVVGSTVLFKIVSAITAIRVYEAEEIIGLDIAEHGERGYNVELFSGAPNFISGKEFAPSGIFDLNRHGAN